MPTPSFVMHAHVAALTLNSSAANLMTAENGVASGTESTLNGCLESDARVILNETFPALSAILELFGNQEERRATAESAVTEKEETRRRLSHPQTPVRDGEVQLVDISCKSWKTSRAMKKLRMCVEFRVSKRRGLLAGTVVVVSLGLKAGLDS